MTEAPVGNLVFITYRRTDVAPHAVALKMALEAQLAAAQVFLDTQAIAAGDTWTDSLRYALASAKIVMPIFGKQWAAAGADGKRRIDDPDDWVHKELLFALEHKRNEIMPVFVDGAAALTAESLPEKLRDLALIQGFRISTDQWYPTVDALIGQIATRFSLDRRKFSYTLPQPNSMVAKAPPYPWSILVDEVRTHLPGWRIEFTDDPDNSFNKRVTIVREFDCGSFKKAMEFTNMAAQLATDLDHHPHIKLVWKWVTVSLTTFDAGHRVTIVDYKFARFLNRAFNTLTRI